MFARTFILIVLLACLSLSGLGGCGSAREGGADIEYKVSATDNYKKGMQALGDEEWADAAKYFAFVKARFPYSKFAVLADVRIADAAYGAGAYLEAIDGYKQFIKFHPTHDLVENGYAEFRVGECYYHMLPDDWWIMPPSYEKDQSATLDALRELGNFIHDFPQSTLIPKAQKMRKECAHALAAHEWYVADYYWKRHLPMGTVLRLRTLLNKYPNAGFDERALLRLGDAYAKVGRGEDARRAWSALEAFPGSATTARDRLSAHPSNTNSAPPTGAPVPPTPATTPAPTPATKPAPAPAPGANP